MNHVYLHLIETQHEGQQSQTNFIKSNKIKNEKENNKLKNLNIISYWGNCNALLLTHPNIK